MKEQSTPRPWAIMTIRGGYLIEGPGGASQRVVRGAGGVREEADAKLIVTAVNAHDALVAALDGFVLAVDVEYGDEPMPESFERAYRRANAALAKAKGMA